ncbi:polyprenyl synthetase family protein [Candidatus Desantisbacteria bacterium]|nr:polyprenyl synthetase family protein [Candidatus Desantisbacteria bacterium]
MNSIKHNKFSLEKYFKKNKEIIDKALDKYLPEDSIYPESIHKAMRYSIFAGGKRLRAILVIAGCQIFSPEEIKNALPVACAVEMIHTYSLIHDDLPCIDNDDLRRGKPTSHKVFGEATAVLTGDALLTHAFLLMSKRKNIKPEITAQVIEIISKAISTYGMIGGQIVDIETSGIKTDAKTLKYIHNHKTADLIEACVYAGAFLGGADSKQLKYISEYGRNIGLAFQIVDDILDIEGDTKLLGKSAGSDIINKKNTYPSLFGIKKSRQLSNKLINNAILKAKKFGQRGQILELLANFIRDRKF